MHGDARGGRSGLALRLATAGHHRKRGIPSALATESSPAWRPRWILFRPHSARSFESQIRREHVCLRACASVFHMFLFFRYRLRVLYFFFFFFLSFVSPSSRSHFRRAPPPVLAGVSRTRETCQHRCQARSYGFVGCLFSCFSLPFFLASSPRDGILRRHITKATR